MVDSATGKREQGTRTWEMGTAGGASPRATLSVFGFYGVTSASVLIVGMAGREGCGGFPGLATSAVRHPALDAASSSAETSDKKRIDCGATPSSRAIAA